MTQTASTKKKAPAKKSAAKTTKKAAAKAGAKPKSSTASKTKAKAKPRAKKANWKSRAVLRTVEAGNSVDCMVCGERIKFRAKIRQYQAICNVYEKGVWKRVEHFHQECYEEAGYPFGKPAE